jgi:hypothetical protein
MVSFCQMSNVLAARLRLRYGTGRAAVPHPNCVTRLASLVKTHQIQILGATTWIHRVS